MRDDGNKILGKVRLFVFRFYTWIMKLFRRFVYHFERHHVLFFRHIRNDLLELHSAQKEHLAFDKNMLCREQGTVLVLEFMRRIEGLGGYKDTYKMLFCSGTIAEYTKEMLPVISSDGFVLSQMHPAVHSAFFHILRNTSMKAQIELLLQALKNRIHLYFVEPGFICCVTNVDDKGIPIQYRRHYSYIVDDRGFYYDALVPSRIEQYLNSEASRLGEAERERARGLICALRANKLSKYNYQPDRLPEQLQNTRKKVLVLDQSRKDASVLRGMADEHTFADMLHAALTENRDSDIVIKTHPDSINRGRGSYYAKVRSEGRIFKISESVNPYSLLEAVDKVYVCSSLMGLEALFCEKETHVFGMPIYAGWGLTKDRQVSERRMRTLTLEELVHALYITFSVYIHPHDMKICEVEEFLDAFSPLVNIYNS